MTNGAEAVDASIQQDRYHSRLVTAVLACAWLAVISSTVASGLMLAIDGSAKTAALAAPMATLMFLTISAGVAVVVLNILGGMWRPWVDGLMTAALLIITLGAGLMSWPVMTSQIDIEVSAFRGCVTSADSCTVHGSNSDIWTGVAIQTVIVAALLVCTSHWAWRLHPQVSKRKPQAKALIALCLVCVAVVAAIDLNIPTSRTVDGSGTDPSNSGSFSYSPLN